MKTARIPVCVVGVLLVGVAPALAQWDASMQYDSKVISNRWSLWAGGFRPEFTTEFAISSGSVLGTLIRLEGDLGLEDDIVTGRVGGFYRFSRKRAIFFDFTTLERSSIKGIGRTIVIGEGDDEITFDVGAIVASQFDNDILIITYRHSFINNGKTEAGFTAGASLYAFDLSLTGMATVDDGVNPPVIKEATGDTSVVVPVPAFGMFINHALAPNWILRMQARFLNLTVGDYEGRYLNTSVSIDWVFTKHFGLGLGLTGSDVDFRDNGGDRPYQVEYRLGGPMIYASVVF